MKRLAICIAIIILLLVGIILFPFNIQTTKPNKHSTTDVPRTTPAPTVFSGTPGPTLDLYSRRSDLPYDKLFITEERQKYKSGDLTLIIPKLSLTEAVENGTSTEALKKGPGLYDYAQLPGEGDRNVSIAAHRNHSNNGVISEWFFYYIDTMCEGDYIYLTDKKKIYRYLYDQTTIVEETDWSPIYSQGVSCITLTSCEPIGVADHRIIVRGILDSIVDYDKNYTYYSDWTLTEPDTVSTKKQAKD